MDNIEAEYGQFVAAHQQQLVSSQIPQILWQHLFLKLRGNILDSNAVFQRHREIEDEKHYLITTANDIKANNEIFLFKHAWFTQGIPDANHFKNNPDLVSRLWDLMELEIQKKKQDEFDEKHLGLAEIVKEQTGVSIYRAKELLKQNNYELIEAITSAQENEEGVQINSELVQRITSQFEGANSSDQNAWVAQITQFGNQKRSLK